MRFIIKCLAACLALSAAATFAHAAPYEAYTFTSAGGSTDGGFGPSQGQNTGSGTVTAGIASSVAEGQGSFYLFVDGEPPYSRSSSFSSASSATVSGGLMRGSAAGGASSSVSAGNDVSATAVSRATMHFIDTIYLTSAALPIGTPIQLQVTSHLSLHSTPSFAQLPAGFPRSGTELSYTGRIFNADFAIPFSHTVGGTGIEVPTGIYESTGTISVKVGDAIQVEGAMEVFGASVDASYSIDASNTAAIVLTPLGDFTFTSASGADYATIPEPASFALLAMAGMVLVRRRS